MAEHEGVRPIIVKKRKGGAGEGHGGSAWKIAYADFVTAMMAFFLLLWLLNATEDEKLHGIADYFSPTPPQPNGAGADGLLGGQSMTEPGMLRSAGSPEIVLLPLPPESLGDGEANEAPIDPDDILDPAPAQPVVPEALQPPENPEDRAYPLADEDPRAQAEAEQLSEQELAEQLAEREERQFQQVEQQLRQAIERVPELAQLGDSLLIDRTPEGLRIQLVDQDGLSMFPIGSSAMYDHTRRALELVAQAVAGMPNEIMLAGHTDATPYRTDGGYGNWELSADRANASRRVLIEAGLDEARVNRVVGQADRDPLDVADPTSPVNRRISIILLRDNPLPPEPIDLGGAAAPPAAEPAGEPTTTGFNLEVPGPPP